MFAAHLSNHCHHLERLIQINHAVEHVRYQAGQHTNPPRSHSDTAEVFVIFQGLVSLTNQSEQDFVKLIQVHLGHIDWIPALIWIKLLPFQSEVTEITARVEEFQTLRIFETQYIVILKTKKAISK